MGATATYFRHIKEAVASIFDGMAVSASHLIRKPYTIQYPDRMPVRVQDNAQTREILISQFDIDMAKCMYCGLCSEVCPTGSIHHTTEFEGADYSLESLIRRFITEPFVAYKPKKGPEPDPDVAKLLDRGMKYVDEWAPPGSDKPPANAAAAAKPAAAASSAGTPPRPAPQPVAVAPKPAPQPATVGAGEPAPTVASPAPSASPRPAQAEPATAQQAQPAPVTQPPPAPASPSAAAATQQPQTATAPKDASPAEGGDAAPAAPSKPESGGGRRRRPPRKTRRLPRAAMPPRRRHPSPNPAAAKVLPSRASHEQVVTSIIFYALAGLTVLSAAITAFSRNIVYSAFALLGAFGGVVGIYILLGADFVAMVQIFVYIGGILVLTIFAVMLTQGIADVNVSNREVGIIPALITVALVGAVMLYAILRTNWYRGKVAGAVAPTTYGIGNAFLGPYVLPFEIASLVLLAALIGAVVISRQEIRE